MDDKPPTARRPGTQPLPVAVPLPTQDEELREANAALARCRQRLALLTAQVRLIQRADALEGPHER